MVQLLRRSLERIVPKDQIRAVETGIDVIGDIAIVKLDDPTEVQGALVGNAIMASMKNVRVVFDQKGGLEGDFRLRRLVHIAGERRTLTMHRENGLRFMVDVEKCYFSPRLSTERMRVADMTRTGEKVLNMFAGVGPFSNTLSKKKGATVYSNEINVDAFELHIKNNTLNKVDGSTVMSREDAIRLPELIDAKFDRVLMPHPSRSDRYLPAAISMTKPGGWIHYYRHVSGYNVEQAGSQLSDEVKKMTGSSVNLGIRRVREIGPRYLELVAEIQLRD